jgi:DNA repair exonuclease SbcCD ATPase subunit
MKEKVEERRDLTQCENMIKELREFLERKSNHLNDIEQEYRQMKSRSEQILADKPKNPGEGIVKEIDESLREIQVDGEVMAEAIEK